jgi:DNA polymerase-1
VRIAVDVGTADFPPRVQRRNDDGSAAAPPEILSSLHDVAGLERSLSPRWVLARPRAYRRLLDAGVSPARAHDVELTEGLLAAADGHFGEPQGLAAAVARLAGRPPEPDPPVEQDAPPALFANGPVGDELADVVLPWRRHRGCDVGTVAVVGPAHRRRRRRRGGRRRAAGRGAAREGRGGR